MSPINKVMYCMCLIIVGAFGLSQANTPIRPCANGKPLPLNVQINDCNTLPCDIWKGVNTHMAIQFVATKDNMSSLRAEARQTYLGTQIPCELDEQQSDICKNLLFGAYCPLDREEDVTYHLVMPVNDNQPEQRYKLEVNLIDKTDNSVVSCFVTDTRVKKYKQILN